MSASLFLAGRVLVRPHDGRIEHDPVQLGGLQGRERPFPHAFLGQAAEALADGVVLAEAFGQVRSRAAGAHYPHDGVEKKAVILGRYPAIGGFAGQQRGNGFPLLVRNFMTTHIAK